MVPLQTDVYSFYYYYVFTQTHIISSLLTSCFIFYLVLMLAENVIIKLSSRIPTDRERGKDGAKLSAIWERRDLRIPAACMTGQQVQRAG